MSLPTLDSNDGNRRKKPGGLPSMDMPPIEPPNEMPNLDSEMPRIDDFAKIDEFKEISPERALYEESDEGLNEEIYGRIDDNNDSSELPDMLGNEEGDYDLEDDYNPDYEEDLENEGESKFIDKKKKRLLPFGGKKSKKPKMFVKSSDFDDRKNKLARTKITQLIVVLVITILFLIGLKNTFMPSHVYTSEQIRQFAAEGAGQTGFPEGRGQAYVENFANSYLTFDRTKPELLGMLSHYYGKDDFTNSNMSTLNMSWGFDAKQYVIIPPKVVDVELLSDYSAQYKVTSYVSNTDGQETDGKDRVGRWLTFAVNVYYNEELDSLAITEESPMIIPSQPIQDHTDVPRALELGTGQVNKEIYPAIGPTIDGFIEAFAKSSIESHNPVLQYIDNRDDISLYDGFGGALELEGNSSGAIKKVVYNTLKEGVYEVDVTVNWVDVAASQGDNKVTYTSRYQMEVESHGEGKFVVTAFSPYKFYK